MINPLSVVGLKFDEAYNKLLNAGFSEVAKYENKPMEWTFTNHGFVQGRVNLFTENGTVTGITFG